MKDWAKGGVIGFGVVFVGLLILLLFIGHDSGGWKCYTVESLNYCNFIQFLFSPLHIGFILFFSWVGFFAGIIDTKLIKKIINEKNRKTNIYLKITLTIMLTLVFVFWFIGIIVFDNWIVVFIYSIIFTIFVLLVSWGIGKYKYGR